MDVYVLLQWQKGGVRFAKGLNTTIYKPIKKRKPEKNPASRFCWRAKERERGSVRAIFGHHVFEQPPYLYICVQIYIYLMEHKRRNIPRSSIRPRKGQRQDTVDPSHKRTLGVLAYNMHHSIRWPQWLGKTTYSENINASNVNFSFLSKHKTLTNHMWKNQQCQ